MALFCLALLYLSAFASGTDIFNYESTLTLAEQKISDVSNKDGSGRAVKSRRSASSKYYVIPDATTASSQPLTSIFTPDLSLKTSTPHTSRFFHSINRSHSGILVRSVSRYNSGVQSTPSPYTTPNTHEVPSLLPHMRKFFTPPLPPEYSNPFADKPTLRGSYSDSGSSNRRPIPPPPRPPSNRERIPDRPPDLVPLEKERSSPRDKKKPLNTPSFNRPPETPFSEVSNSNFNVRHNNESEYETVPSLHSPSVSRILSGSSGRKPSNPGIIIKPNTESKAPQLPGIYPRTETSSVDVQQGSENIALKPSSNQSLFSKSDSTDTKEKQTGISGVQDTVPADADLAVDERSTRRDEELPDDQQQPPKSDDRGIHVAISPSTPAHKDLRGKWGVAWDVHVYLTGSLFTVLSICSFINIARANSCRRLLSYGYFVSLHALLFVVGILRSVYLFYDGYNVNKSFPEPVSLLMFHIVSPCITSAFLVLFLFLLLTTKVYVFGVYLQKPTVIAIFIIVHIVLCVSLDLASGFSPESFLSLICQCLFVLICVCVGLAYLYSYRMLVRSATRKMDSSFGNNFTNIHHPTLSIAIRLTLAAALLSLLLSAAHLYGIFGVDDNLEWEGKSLPWLRWGHQFSVRVIEIAICFLLLSAGVQPMRQDRAEAAKGQQNSGLALFRCRQCTNTTQSNETADDIYPAVCVTNQAIHDYTVRTGKKVYDDSFPLNNLHTSFSASESGFSVSTSERRLLRKSGYVPHEAPFPVTEVGSTERRSVKKGPVFTGERAEFDIPFSTVEVRRSLKGSGTLARHNVRRPEPSFKCSSSNDGQAHKTSGIIESQYCGAPVSSDVRRSVKKSGTLVSLNSERRTPVHQHRNVSQTLSSARERISPSMLVAENGFVRFRTLADTELDPSEMVRR
ncbi:uncharacterized protein LOC126469638 isoform X1 [Schistocerca serialis cubense]|uniref:uncharacterized protein LOC126469638 isoform X1 n=1 Tax=Schistocerca serialis cubense TaxID=2023355 RepID=UPI00214EE2E3|nr:uncharacterized protein LOC126469638 isoform X1 [Schistocerca serialis cubense]XP_049952721.1 uncharacterized protein LOC126469638 isoform X1 [Schistocerca serialis cubense]